MNIEWDYSYYQPWSDNEWLVDEMLAMQEEMLITQNKDITVTVVLWTSSHILYGLPLHQKGDISKATC